MCALNTLDKIMASIFARCLPSTFGEEEPHIVLLLLQVDYTRSSAGFQQEHVARIKVHHRPMCGTDTEEKLKNFRSVESGVQIFRARMGEEIHVPKNLDQ